VGSAILAVVLAVTGCADDTGVRNPDEPTSSGGAVSRGPVRTDRDPVAERFPRLGDFNEVHWLGWRIGSDSGRGVPGPSDVMIQAFVELRAEEFESTRDGYEWQQPPDGWTENIAEELHPYVPETGDWGYNERYASEVRTAQYGGGVYLNLATGTVYLNLNSH
jgi:hypothetical protein